MPKYCVPRKFEAEEQQSLDEGSERQNDWRSLLFELSPTVRIFWAEKYNCYINPNGKYQTLLGFADMRERFLQASHESSMELFYRVGWEPMDTMCAYLLGMTTNRIYNLSPDAVRAALLRAFVCNYLWSCSDWEKVKDHPAGQAMAKNLLWGYYRNGELQTVFALKEDGSVLHGYGAQLTFDGIWRGPEYGPEIITMDKVIFYRFRHFQRWDYVPESLVCIPEELPARFVSTALAAFRAIVGKGKKRMT